jgi:excinuclease UvrABC nuclease subunit
VEPVSAKQLHLFDPPNPLLDRVGADLFRAAPRCPGVYIMTGASERVLYIGQSKNLRTRLASYKNARPDRAPRKVIRLVHEIEAIAWESCESAEAARLRENELLRLHRPKFNRMNTFPQRYFFLWLRINETGFELGWTRSAEPGIKRYGAFKSNTLSAYAALLRMLWSALHQAVTEHEYPRQLLLAKPPSSYRFETAPGPSSLAQLLDAFLTGSSDELLNSLAHSLPPAESLSPFHHALHRADAEALAQFYRFGPRRNHELSLQNSLPAPLIRQDQLDDLLAMAGPPVAGKAFSVPNCTP